MCRFSVTWHSVLTGSNVLSLSGVFNTWFAVDKMSNGNLSTPADRFRLARCLPLLNRMPLLRLVPGLGFAVALLFNRLSPVNRLSSVSKLLAGSGSPFSASFSSMGLNFFSGCSPSSGDKQGSPKLDPSRPPTKKKTKQQLCYFLRKLKLLVLFSLECQRVIGFVSCATPIGLENLRHSFIRSK